MDFLIAEFIRAGVVLFIVHFALKMIKKTTLEILEEYLKKKNHFDIRG